MPGGDALQLFCCYMSGHTACSRNRAAKAMEWLWPHSVTRLICKTWNNCSINSKTSLDDSMTKVMKSMMSFDRQGQRQLTSEEAGKAAK